MIQGITENDKIIIQKILSPYKPEYDFFCYGSRVKGNFSKLSDLDILIKGNQEFPYDQLEIVKIMFDNSDLSFIVNLVDYFRIDKKFYKMIEKDLVSI